MNWVDTINGAFVFGGASYAAANAYKLWKDREIKGIYISSTIFFTVWTLWGIFYYYDLRQWFSFYCNLLMAVADSVWVAMAIVRCRNGRPHKIHL